MRFDSKPCPNFHIYYLVTKVPLTQTAKKTREHKATVVSDIREAIDEHDNLYLFSYENMRSHKFKKIRMDFREPDMEGKTSRIFLGKNKLMQIALGRTPEDEYADSLREVSKLITGSVGLLLTSKSASDVEEYFQNLVEEDFARAGSTATQKVIVTNEMLYNHPVSMVDQFRKLGVPVEVKIGKLVLVGKPEYTLCKVGTILNAEQCKALLQFGIKLAEFKVKLECRWSSDGSFDRLH